MATADQKQQQKRNSLENSINPDPSQFTPKLHPRWAMGIKHVAVVAFFGTLFLLLNFLPIRATDIWGHVAYGEWILTHGSLPSEDPWMPLAVGMQVVDTAWLSQVAFALADRAARGFNVPGLLSHLFALVGLATYLVWARIFYLQAKSVWLMLLLASLLLVLVGWSRIATIRPETFAALCFAVLMWLIVSSQQMAAGSQQMAAGQEDAPQPRQIPWRLWIGVPLVMALWANLHGSFVVGLVVLGCYFLGRVLEVAWQQRSFWAVLSDRGVRRWLLLTELALAATLLNPYGVDLWIHTVRFSSNPNLAAILEWQSLNILGVGGWSFALSWVLLVVVLRHSRQPIPPAHVLLLGVFTVAVVLRVRMIGWYAPLFTMILVPQVAEIVRRLFPAQDIAQPQPQPDLDTEDGEADEPTSANKPYVLPPGRSFIYSLICLLLIWVVFAVSPSGRAVLGRKPRTPQQLHDRDTPLALTAHLRESPPDGQVFNPQWWGDWLKRDGPPELQVFVTSNIHLVPRQVWLDYLRVTGMRPGWQRSLDRYRVNTMILDKEAQSALASLLRRDDQWQLSYEDEQAIVFQRDANRSARKNAEDDIAPDLTDEETL